MKENEKGEIPEIPDWTIDMHTNKGRFELGRDVFYFMHEASKVEPLWEEYDDTYFKQLYKMYEEEGKRKQRIDFFASCRKEMNSKRLFIFIY